MDMMEVMRFFHADPSHRKRSGSAGQALLIVVITMIVALTVGLSLASRTITNLKISQQNEDSQRAFQAASAGIEKYIQTATGVNTGNLTTGVSYSTNVQDVSGTTVALNNGENIDQDRGIDVWLSNYPDYSNGMGTDANTNLTVCWATPEQIGASNCNTAQGGKTTPALEIVLLTGNPNAPTLRKYVYDACGTSRTAGAAAPTLLSMNYENEMQKVFAYNTTSIEKEVGVRIQQVVKDVHSFAENNTKVVSGAVQGLIASTFSTLNSLTQTTATAQSTGITFRSATTVVSGTANPDITLSKPTGVVQGDVMVANIGFNSVNNTNDIISVPASWNLIGTALSSDGALRLRMYYKVATSSEPSSYTWTMSTGNAGFNGGILAYSGVSTSSPIDTNAVSIAMDNNISSSAHAASGVTATAGETVLVFFNGVNPSANWGSTSSWGATTPTTTSRVTASNTTNRMMRAFDLQVVASGATGSFTSTPSRTVEAGTAVIALRPNSIPTLSSPTKTNITHNSATLGGNVTSDGGFTVTQRGVCVGTSADPVLGGNCFVNGTAGTGVFTVSATSLSSNTTYHYRAYATNANGTNYTTDDTFTTSAAPSVPTVTSSAGNPFDDNITITNNITSSGNPSTLTARGTCWGTTVNPTNCVAQGGTTAGSFNQNITGLSPNTLYHYRGFATNATGTGYSSDQTFTTAPAPPTWINPPVTSTTTSLQITAGSRNISWTTPTGATHYYLRINDNATPWNPGVDPALCDTAQPASPTTGNICKYLTTNSYTYNFQAGHSYTIWVHSSRAGEFSNASAYPVTAGVAGPTPTPVTGAATNIINCKYQTAPIALTNASPGLIMKVIPMYNSTKVQVTSSSSLAPFPSQGKVIESTGSSGDTKRKIVYYESHPQIPNEFFSYGIMSQ